MNYRPPMPPAPPAEPKHHACLSGAAWCSGLSPCPECFYEVRGSVMAVAIAHSGANGSAAASLYDLVNALRMRGIDPAAHLGVQIDYTKLDPREQTRAALEGYELGFRLLHEKLATDPRVKLTPVSFGAPALDAMSAYPTGPAPHGPQPIYPDAAGVFAGGRTEPAAHRGVDPFDMLGLGQSVAAAPRVEAPAAGGSGSGEKTGAVLGSIFASAKEAVPAFLEEPPKPPPPPPVPIERLAPRGAVEVDKARAATRPLDAEEIALAALPVDEGSATTPDSDHGVNGIGTPDPV